MSGNPPIGTLRVSGKLPKAAVPLGMWAKASMGAVPGLRADSPASRVL